MEFYDSVKFDYSVTVLKYCFYGVLSEKNNNKTKYSRSALIKVNFYINLGLSQDHRRRNMWVLFCEVPVLFHLNKASTF